MKKVDFVSIETVREYSNLKNKKGITLIALVITIIVLLILAGVSIATITGENGILERTKSAKEASENATNEENSKISQYESEINKYVTSRDGSYTSTIFHGTVKTNTMGAPDTTTIVNEYTVEEDGNYIVNYIGQLKWNADSVFGLVLIKIDSNDTEETIGGEMYSNQLTYSSALLNATAIENLKKGEIIRAIIYQYNNGVAGANNLVKNDLQLIKIGN